MEKLFKKKNIKKYLIYYAIVEAMFGFTSIRILFVILREIIKIMLSASDFETVLKSMLFFLASLGMWFVIVVFQTLPVTIYLLAKKSADITQEIQNRNYNSKENIPYFREKLEGISPATLSIMLNLKIEEEKDIAATLMKLQLNKNIEIENDTINVLSEDVTKLTSSEKQLFYMIADKKINKKQLEAWKVAAIGEAKTQGFIEEQNPKKGLLMKKINLVVILILMIVLGDFCYTKLDEIIVEMEQKEMVEVDSIYEFAEQEDFELVLEGMFVGVGALACVIGTIAWPIFYFVYTRRYKNKNNSLKRTEKGEQLTDVIWAMKRFIQDFSLLDSATREQIVLWDDFLIYAIVLEENTQIVDEILEIKNIKNINTTNLIN